MAFDLKLLDEYNKNFEIMSDYSYHPCKSLEEMEKSTARMELSHIEAALVLLENEELACSIKVGPIEISISVNSRLKENLINEREELEKFLRGEKNNYE